MRDEEDKEMNVTKGVLKLNMEINIFVIFVEKVQSTLDTTMQNPTTTKQLESTICLARHNKSKHGSIWFTDKLNMLNSNVEM